MTSIDGISRLTDLIRQRVGKQAASHTRKSSANTDAAVTAEPPSFSHLIDRVGTISPDDPERERKAFRYFLEATLLTEFGMEIINDPGFYRLVDRVQAQMESNPKIHAAAKSAAVLLLRMKAGSTQN